MIGSSHLKHAALTTFAIQPKFRMRAVLFFGACLAALAVVSYLKPQPYRAAYGALGAATAITLTLQYRREHGLIRNRLSATGVVTDYRLRGRGAPHLGKGVPIIRYEFVAFDLRTYHGETGWGTQRLNNGSQLTILYDPGNPTTSHPLKGFVFYSFERA
jgi:hypothetical protein